MRLSVRKHCKAHATCYCLNTTSPLTRCSGTCWQIFPVCPLLCPHQLARGSSSSCTPMGLFSGGPHREHLEEVGCGDDGSCSPGILKCAPCQTCSCLCVRVRVCVCVRACVPCMRVCVVHAVVSVCMHVCLLNLRARARLKRPPQPSLTHLVLLLCSCCFLSRV